MARKNGWTLLGSLAAVVVAGAAIVLAQTEGDGGAPGREALSDPAPEPAAAQAEGAEGASPDAQPASRTAEPQSESQKEPAAIAEELSEVYGDLALIDVHNHDSWRFDSSLTIWNRYRIGKVVLFGSVSEPAAVATDRLAWDAYKRQPDRVYPFFSGFDIHEPEGLDTVRENLEQGYLGIGETYAASSHTPISDRLAWKGQHPMDANLPEVYAIAAEYDAPVLLHIDPPSGLPLDKLEEAMETYPDTTFIFAHANVYNPPEVIDRLLAEHPNLYIDFFPGFTSYNPASPFETAAYIETIERYPDRFFLSTDAAFDMTYEEAIAAMYTVIDSLKPETRAKVASGNFQALIDRQKPTAGQLERFGKLGGDRTRTDVAAISRHEMNKLLFELERG